MSDVVVVGGGPVGLMVGAELALAGVEVEILERRASPELESSRGGGVNARTVEILDQRGILDRFLAEGKPAQVHQFAGSALDISDFPSRHPYTLSLFQRHFDRILRGWVQELGVPIRRGVEVTDHAQDDDGVDVVLAGGETIRARYLVGADGGRSVVRKRAGIDLVGPDATRCTLIAEVEVTEEPPQGVRYDDLGVHGIGLLEGGPTMRMVVTEREPGRSIEPTLADLSAALHAVYGTDFGVHSPTWLSWFTDATRQASAYRSGRVLLAGDAAHVHSPTGGQGIGLGLQDAVNLGWKLAQVVRGVSSATLLDSYHDERHPAGARVLDYSMAQTLFQRRDPRIAALGGIVDRLLMLDDARRLVGGLISGLDVAYDLGEGHPLLGRRMPDLDLVTNGGPTRLYALLHAARPVLLDLLGGLDVGPWADRVHLVRAESAGPWDLPVLGTVSAPTAVLIRPDGHVSWVGEGSDDGLRAALASWFGPDQARARLSAQGTPNRSASWP